MKIFLCGLFGLALVSGAVGHAAPAQTPEAFLRALYAHYASGQSAFDPTGAAADTLFTPSLLALIRQDQAEAHGEVGRLDRDPICACQDFDGFFPQSIRVTGRTADTARAVVRFDNEGSETVVIYRLVELNGQWRIDDIDEPGIPSLRGYLAVKDQTGF